MTYGLHDVSVSFGARRALEHVSIDVAAASISVLVGGDGAGKSTALAALVGLVPVSSGRVRRPSKSQIGYVPATAGLFGDLTVEENLDFVARAFNISGAQRDARSSELLERTGLTRARRRLGSQLSGGMRRKLAIVMALLSEPRLLVLDEPTTGVDPVSRVEIWRLLSTAAVDGVAIAVATTYVAEATRGSTTVLLAEGRMLASGAPEEILSSVPGVVGTCPTRPVGPAPTWRRGKGWRVWSADGSLGEGCSAVEADLEDAVVVAELGAVSLP